MEKSGIPGNPPPAGNPADFPPAGNPSDLPPAYSGPDGPPAVGPPGPSVTYVSAGGAIAVLPPMGSTSQGTVCPSCNLQIVTAVRPKTTTKTHLMAALLCIIGCWPCAAIPYFMDTCKSIDHYCPNCQAYLGSYKG